jgi:diguanylate cyclase (GGDEF)-like protein
LIILSSFSDALDRQTATLARWLLDSDAVFALLLAPDGAIRFRNLAANRIFPHDSAGVDEPKIWDFLNESDAEPVRLRLSDPAAQTGGPFHLNLSEGSKSPVTVEVGLVGCEGGFLLVGAIEERNALRLQAERQMLTNQLAAMARELARKEKELEAANHVIERIARTDLLTGLANRRGLDEMLSREMARANRQHQPLTLILADIDHFKLINDTYGYGVGDQVLVTLGRVFGSQVRPYDVAARLNGEKFALVFPGTACSEGVAIAERLRKQVGAVHIPDGPERISVSFGVATLTERESGEDFLARTDSVLSKAKNSGRNRVEADGVGVLQS